MDTKTALLEAARQSFLERGYAATSLETLAAGLGLTKAAIYHHYASKRALLEALLEESSRAAEQALEGHADMEQALLAFADAYRERLEPLTIVMTALSGRRGGDQEAAGLASRAMQRGMLALNRYFAERGYSKPAELSATLSSIVHGAYMMAKHLPGLELQPLLRRGVSVFVRGLSAEGTPR